MHASPLSINSPAKINLFLEITEKRSDGFHNLESVFQTIPLYDTVTLEESDELTLEVDNPSIPTDMNNLILKAADLLRKETGTKRGGHFILKKNIPNTGGLGGGSSNAASALMLLNKMWKTGLNNEELAEIGSKVGSDVAFFIYGGVCLCQGRGEVVTPLASIDPLPVNIIAPNWGISTPSAFSHLSIAHFNKYKVSNFIETLNKDSSSLEDIYNASFNHFEQTVFEFEPRQKELHDRLMTAGFLARMSGSGSCIWAFNPKNIEPKSLLTEGCRFLI